MRVCSWVNEFILYQPVCDDKDKRRSGGFNILMEYFSNLNKSEWEGEANYLCILCLRALLNNRVRWKVGGELARAIHSGCVVGWVQYGHGPSRHYQPALPLP